MESKEFDQQESSPIHSNMTTESENKNCVEHLMTEMVRNKRLEVFEDKSDRLDVRKLFSIINPSM